MSVLDIILIALLGFGLIRGFFKGFFVEIASLVALIAGVYGAIHFSYFVAEFLQSKTQWSEQTINISAFAITFVIIIFMISLAGKALTKLASFAMLGIVNKLLGGVFGTLKMALIASVLLLVASKINGNIPFLDEKELDNSILYNPVKSLAPMIYPYVIKAENEEDKNENDELNRNNEST